MQRRRRSRVPGGHLGCYRWFRAPDQLSEGVEAPYKMELWEKDWAAVGGVAARGGRGGGGGGARDGFVATEVLFDTLSMITLPFFFLGDDLLEMKVSFFFHLNNPIPLSLSHFCARRQSRSPGAYKQKHQRDARHRRSGFFARTAQHAGATPRRRQFSHQPRRIVDSTKKTHVSIALVFFLRDDDDDTAARR